jgi:hypothetical protein
MAHRKEDQIKEVPLKVAEDSAGILLRPSVGTTSQLTVSGWTLTEFLKRELSLIFMTFFHNDQQHMLHVLITKLRNGS